MYGCVTRSLYGSSKTLYRSPVCRCQLLNKTVFRKQPISYCRPSYLKNKLTESENVDDKSDEHNLSSAFADKYKIFKDEDAPVIFDVNEERKRIALSELDVKEEVEDDPYAGVSLTHGITGVYEIEDLVNILEKERARNIFAVSVPSEYSYVDYLVLVTGRSQRHMQAMATIVRKIYKLKKYKHETIPKIEGENSKDWIAIDLGNIALHIFSHEARQKYDLETLWAVGSEFDDLSNIKDEDDIMDKYKSFLKDLQPAE